MMSTEAMLADDPAAPVRRFRCASASSTWTSSSSGSAERPASISLEDTGQYRPPGRATLCIGRCLPVVLRCSRVRRRDDQVSAGGRARTRGNVLRRVALIAGALVVLALLLFLTGHWLLGIIVGVVAAAAVWGFLQARSVR